MISTPPSSSPGPGAPLVAGRCGASGRPASDAPPGAPADSPRAPGPPAAGRWAPGPWIVTREPEDAAPLVDALRARGLEAVCVPCIERAPLGWPARLAPGDDALWFLTSPYAARLVLARVVVTAAYAPPRARFAAVAPRTADVVVEAGARVDVTAEGGAVALAHAVVDAGFRGRVLYPTSDAGLAQPEQQEAVALLAARGEVVREAVYATRPPAGLADALAARAGPLKAVVFSPSAARALAGAVAARPGAAAVVCVGESTARALPFPSTLVPRGADVADFIRSLEDKP